MARSSTPEWLAFDESVKPALRIWASAARAAKHAQAASRRGYAVVVVDVAGGDTAIVYIARTPALARELSEIERASLPGRAEHTDPPRTDAVRRTGELLGYPRCCVGAFATRNQRGVDVLADGQRSHEDHVAASEALARSSRLDPLLNVYPLEQSMLWLSHVPCRFDCEPSLSYAADVRSRFGQRFPDQRASIDAALSQDVAINRDGRKSTLDDAGPGACLLRFSIDLDPDRGGHVL